MVGGGGVRDDRIATIRPVEFAAVYNHTAQAGAVPTQKLGGRVDCDVCAPFQWPAEVGRGEGIVHHQRAIVLVRQICHRLDIENIAGGIADSFRKQELGIVVDCRPPGVHIIGINEIQANG